ncbi:mechanosensitive ion channel protein MscS [Moraxella caviae]|nr:mechanosensitive ion channel protein MscS [Moraxella caviae]
MHSRFDDKSTAKRLVFRLIAPLLIVVLAFGAMFSVQAASVASALTGDEAQSVQASKDSFGRDTPRGTVQGFIRAIANHDNELAANYLDGRFLANTDTPNAEIVTRLKNALDAGGKLDPDLQISGAADGNLSDNLPADIDKVGTIHLMNQQFDILLAKRVSDDGVVFWQFAGETLEKLPSDTRQTPTLAQRFGVDKLGDGVLGSNVNGVFGVKSGELVALLMLVLMLGVVVYAAVWVLYGVWKVGYVSLRKKEFRVTPKIILPLTVIIVSFLLPEAMVRLGVPVTLRSSFGRVNEILAWGAAAWLALRLLDALFNRAEARSLRLNRPEQVSILNLLRKIAKVLMLILAMIIIFGNLGFDLTTGIAALGVGGLALAFGAQKTIENLIGSVVVVADRPVRVGDYCRFGTMEGTVIDIGIRSTRLRTLNRTIVTVPNGEFSALQIENYAKRDMFYFFHNLYLKRSANPREIGRLIKDLQEFLERHPYVNDEWTLVRLSELRQDCYVVEMRCYVATLDVSEFYVKQSEMLIDVLHKVSEYDVEHALPSQEIAIKTDADAKVDDLAQ